MRRIHLALRLTMFAPAAAAEIQQNDTTAVMVTLGRFTCGPMGQQETRNAERVTETGNRKHLACHPVDRHFRGDGELTAKIPVSSSPRLTRSRASLASLR